MLLGKIKNINDGIKEEQNKRVLCKCKMFKNDSPRDSHEFAKKAFLGHLVFLSLKDKVVSKVAEMVDFSKIRRN